MSKIVLGIDPGFSFTGFGVINKDQNLLKLLDYGTLKLPRTKSLAERINIFYEFLILKIKNFNIQALSIETPFLGKNAQNFLKLGYLRGILYLVSSQYKLNIYEFSPREVKSLLTGFGGADKEQVARMIFKFFPAIRDTEKSQFTLDLTDALAIALCGIWSKF